MGVFIISPTDKGGHLHSPSDRLLELCAPLHPIVFNDLFCLKILGSTHRVGAAHPRIWIYLRPWIVCPMPIDIHRFSNVCCAAAVDALGVQWLRTWHNGLPSWRDTPGKINLPVLLWLHNLVEAWDLESFAKARYRLLGQGGHWFPGANAEMLDRDVDAADLRSALANSPWRDRIPSLLRTLRERLGGEAHRPLSGI